MFISINCRDLIAFVKFSLFLHPDEAHIDGLVQDYLNQETNLWHSVRTTNVNNTDNSVLHIYQMNEQFLGPIIFVKRPFSIQCIVTKTTRYGSNENRAMERFVLQIIDDIHHVKISAKNTRRILNQDLYEQLSNTLTSILLNTPKFL